MSLPAPTLAGATRKKKSGLFRELRVNAPLFVMAAPAILFVLINNYIPMLGLSLAFKNISFSLGIFKSPWNGLKNFEFLFKSPDAWIMTRNTVGYNLIFIILGLLIPVAFAIALNELRSARASKLFQSAMLLPNFLSFVVVSYLVFALLSPQAGLVNHILMALGKDPVSWYEDSTWWPLILVLTHVWKNAGYGTVVYLAAIAGIDPSYYEAAVIDGAGKWQQLLKITLPNLKPLMTILTIMAIGRIFNSDFGLFYQVPLNSGLLSDATKTIDVYVFNAVKSEVGLGAAAGFYQSVVGFVLVVFSNWFISKVDPENKIF